MSAVLALVPLFASFDTSRGNFRLTSLRRRQNLVLGELSMYALQASDLRKSFGKGAKRMEAVKGVSLAIKPGEILAFLGRNGAGKTTTIKMIAGLLIPDSGTVTVNGLNPAADSEVYRHLGTVLEGSRNLYMQLTARENLEYFGVARGLSRKAARERAAELLEQFGLTHKAGSRVRELSRGMQQKLSVGVSLVHKPKLLLLDEPTNGLDVESSEAIKLMLNRLTDDGLAVLLTTHQLDVAQEVSDRVAVISAGEIIAEETKAGLLKRFSADSMEIIVEGALSTEVAQRVAALGNLVAVKAEGDNTSVTCLDGKHVYQVLEALRPQPIVTVQRSQCDLTEVFLRLVNSADGGTK